MQGGEGLPEPLLDPPQLREGLELYFDAWWQLDSSRSNGFGPGRIPWDSVQAFGIVAHLLPDQLEDLHYHIGRMDSAYLKWHADKQPKPEGKRE